MPSKGRLAFAFMVVCAAAACGSSAAEVLLPGDVAPRATADAVSADSIARGPGLMGSGS
jgi:hypothetical protein